VTACKLWQTGLIELEKGNVFSITVWNLEVRSYEHTQLRANEVNSGPCLVSVCGNSTPPTLLFYNQLPICLRWEGASLQWRTRRTGDSKWSVHPWLYTRWFCQNNWLHRDYPQPVQVSFNTTSAHVNASYCLQFETAFPSDNDAIEVFPLAL